MSFDPPLLVSVLGNAVHVDEVLDCLAVVTFLDQFVEDSDLLLNKVSIVEVHGLLCVVLIVANCFNIVFACNNLHVGSDVSALEVFNHLLRHLLQDLLGQDDGVVLDLTEWHKLNDVSLDVSL